MKHSQAKYEVYIEQPANQAHAGSIAAQWIWHKVDSAGAVLVHGSHHGSLEACFASARKHRETFGDAPITINLRKGAVGDAPKVIAIAVAERDVTITSQPYRLDAHKASGVDRFQRLAHL